MKLFNKQVITLGALLVLLGSLVGCSAGGNCNTNVNPTPNPTVNPSPSPEPGTLSLAIAAPNQYPARLPVSIIVPVTMANTSNVNATNLVYTIPSATNYTGVTITPNPTGVPGQDCTNIPAGTSCDMTVTVNPYANPGSFRVVATPTVAVSTVSKIINTIFNKTSAIEVTANLGLVDIPNTNSPYYILPGQQVVSANVGESSVAYVSVLIRNDEAGLNSMSLVDDNGNSLSFEAMGSTTYSQYSVNSYKVNIPANKLIQYINVKTNTCTQNCSNSAVVNVVSNGSGILVIDPSYVYMSESYTKQVITLTNIGTGNVTNITYPASVGSPFSIAESTNSCSSVTSLTPNQSCTFIVSYDTFANSGITEYTITYKNSTSTINSSSTLSIPYIGKTGSPILNSNPSTLSFAAANQEHTLVLSNTGNIALTGLSLPTLATPLSLVSDGTTCSNGQQLAVNESCTYRVAYTGAQTDGSVELSFAGSNSNSITVPVDWVAVVAPVIATVTPESGATGVIFTSGISITFDVPMDPTTLIGSNFILRKVNDPTVTIGLTAPIYSEDGKTVTFATEAAMVNDADYQVYIPTPANIKSATGGELDISAYPDSIITQFKIEDYNGGMCNGGFAYILNSSNNSRTSCKVSGTGGIYDCTGVDTPVAGLNTPSAGVANNNEPTTAYYVANYGNSSVAYGGYTNTFDVLTSSDIVSPTGIATNSGNPVFIANSNGTLTKCDTSGSYPYPMSSCSLISPTPTNYPSDAYGLGSFSIATHQAYAYYTANKASNTISLCPDDGNSGNILPCSSAGGSNFNQPVAFGSKNRGDYLLVANVGDDTITRCDRDLDTGALSNCAHTGSLFKQPSAIFEFDDFAYITNKGNNTVTICKDNNGTLTECNAVSYGFAAPTAIMAFDPCD